MWCPGTGGCVWVKIFLYLRFLCDVCSIHLWSYEGSDVGLRAVLRMYWSYTVDVVQ
jgi:hypothetical protein